MLPKAAKMMYAKRNQKIGFKNYSTLAYAQYVWIVLSTDFGNALERPPSSAKNVERKDICQLYAKLSKLRALKVLRVEKDLHQIMQLVFLNTTVFRQQTSHGNQKHLPYHVYQQHKMHLHVTVQEMILLSLLHQKKPLMLK